MAKRREPDNATVIFDVPVTLYLSLTPSGSTQDIQSYAGGGIIVVTVVRMFQFLTAGINTTVVC